MTTRILAQASKEHLLLTSLAPALVLERTIGADSEFSSAFGGDKGGSDRGQGASLSGVRHSRRSPRVIDIGERWQSAALEQSELWQQVRSLKACDC